MAEAKNRKPATVEDIKVGAWLWLETTTLANFEGSLSCPVKITLVKEKKGVFSYLLCGSDQGMGPARSGMVWTESFGKVKAGNCGLSIPSEEELNRALKEEQERVKLEIVTLTNYLGDVTRT